MIRRSIGWLLPALVVLTALLAPASALAAGKPVIEVENVLVGGASTARVEAQIEPGSSETTCSVQYVSEAVFLESGWAHASERSCANAIPGGAGVQTRYVSLSGLTVSTAYRYRVLATNASGTVEGPSARYSTFAIESFGFEALGEHGEPFTQAGGHPYELDTNISFDTTHFENPPAKGSEHGVTVPEGVVRDVKVALPAGLVGSPAAVPQCTYTDVELKTCDPASQVGVIEVEEDGFVSREGGLFNMVTPKGVAALFGARMNLVLNTTMEAKVRSGGDYGVDVASLRITGFGKINRISVRMWGVPGAEGHTPERYCGAVAPGDREREGKCRPTVEGPHNPFLTMPTACAGPLVTTLGVDSYQAIGDFAGAFDVMPAIEGCAALAFAPEIDATPSSGSSDSPSGMNVDLKVPQSEPSDTVASTLKDATVTFPVGVAVDPSSASGLEGCTPEEVGLDMAESEQQRVMVDPRVDRSFKLAFQGAETGVLPAEASAEVVQEALEGLPGIGAGNVKVEGGAGGAFTVAFTGALAGRSLPALTVDASRRAVDHLDIKLAEGVGYPNDSFNLALGGYSTAASVQATAHVVPENVETRVIGYIEENAVTARKGTFVTGETITGPGLPPHIRIRRKAGRVELVRYLATTGSTYPTGEFTGTYEMAIPDTAFHETIDEALEALPPIAYARTLGGPIGDHGAGAYNPRKGHSVFAIAFEPAAAYEAQAMTATPGIEEVPQTISSSFQAGGSETVQASIVQQGGVPHMNGEPAKCPAASKIATVKVKTPLLNHELPGALYLATPHDNPFHSLIALYLAVYDPISGVVIKLPGSVSLNKETGQITTSFENSPQLPFSELKVEIFGAGEAAAKSRAPLTTPETCGSFSTSTKLTPWDGNPAATPASKHPFEITSEPGGGACPATEARAPNAPGLEAGTASPIAGSYSPFVLKLTRQDGSQRFQALDVTLPPGLVGKVTGVEECPQADIEAAEHMTAEGDGAVEQAHPSCPAGSRVGVVHVGAGSGAPFFVSGTAYFAGPYKGAPFSLVFVTPAIAGPFDLGSVVVRAGLYINPETAQVTVKSNPFPTILDGIPLDIRSIGVEMNRPGFTLNPTSCNVMAITGAEASTAGQYAPLSDRFQVGGCNGMPFRPTFAASTEAKTSRKDGAGLVTSVTYPAGAQGQQSDMRYVTVKLPRQLPVRFSTVHNACPGPIFEANPAGCPVASVVGHAVVHTPILPVPLSGPAYFVGHGAVKFPELIMVLQGDGVTVELRGSTFIANDGVISTTFKSVPDVPFESFELNLPEGPDSALSPGGNLCYRTITTKKRVLVRRHGHVVRRHKHLLHKVEKLHRKVRRTLQMPVVMIGQNGVELHSKTTIQVAGCASKPKAHGSKHHKHKHHKKHKVRHKRGKHHKHRRANRK